MDCLRSSGMETQKLSKCEYTCYLSILPYPFGTESIPPSIPLLSLHTSLIPSHSLLLPLSLPLSHPPSIPLSFLPTSLTPLLHSPLNGNRTEGVLGEFLAGLQRSSVSPSRYHDMTNIVISHSHSESESQNLFGNMSSLSNIVKILFI